MLSKITEIVKGLYERIGRNRDNIILAAVVALLVLLSFAAGYITAKKSEMQKQPIKIEFRYPWGNQVRVIQNGRYFI